MTEEIDEGETRGTCLSCGDSLSDHPADALSLEEIERAIRKAERDQFQAHLRGDGKAKAEHIRQAVRLRCVAERAYAIWLP